MIQSKSQRAVMAAHGVAMPGGRFPIPNREYLKRAIQAFGRSKSPDATKAFIIKRAHDLHSEDLLPDEWGASPKAAAARLAVKK